MEEGNPRATVLVVDDDPVSLSLAGGLLEDDYRVLEGAGGGEEALARIRSERPDVVLTDIVMPGFDGYALCRALKEDPDTRDIPVIFLSGAVNLAEFLAGHDVGVEDFLAKPLQPDELRHSVAQTLRNARERRRLAQDAQSAFSTAMVAMSSAGEIGVVLQFIRGSYACRNYLELADAVVAACGEYGLNACVRLHGRTGSEARNRSGNSSALEAGILERMAGFGRIVDFSQRMAISYEHATLMVMDMPIRDADRCGRLRDHLAVLVESADARVRALDDSMALEAKHRALGELIASTKAALAEIDQRHRDNQNDARVIMHTMVASVEQGLARMALTTAQEDEIIGALQRAVQEVMDIFDQGLAVDNHLKAVAEMLERSAAA